MKLDIPLLALYWGVVENELAMASKNKTNKNHIFFFSPKLNEIFQMT